MHQFITLFDSFSPVFSCALDALERIFHQGYKYRNAGVILNGLTPAHQLTLWMFDNTHERFRQVMVAVYQTTAALGPHTVRFAVTRLGGNWAGRERCENPVSPE